MVHGRIWNLLFHETTISFKQKALQQNLRLQLHPLHSWRYNFNISILRTRSLPTILHSYNSTFLLKKKSVLQFEFEHWQHSLNSNRYRGCSVQVTACTIHVNRTSSALSIYACVSMSLFIKIHIIWVIFF